MLYYFVIIGSMIKLIKAAFLLETTSINHSERACKYQFTYKSETVACQPTFLLLIAWFIIPM